jgi:hypothetical protein
MAQRVAPGQFVLHSSAVPDLTAGTYVVHADQSFTAPDATSSTLDSYIEVTGPRYKLPPDQVLSTFPPNKSQGSFSSRLPQIVLKRRTLPWEREADPALAVGGVPSGVPWLALVVLADGECEFLNAKPIAQCVTPGVVLAGRNDTPVGDAIVVTETVVRKVFPTKEELRLLVHVREVDLTDTDLAMGDDDGWLAVVLSNRLPQQNVRYRACLISLEGQYNVLLDQAEVEPNPPAAFENPFVYDNPLFGIGLREIKENTRSTTVADGWSVGVTRGYDTRARNDRPWLPPPVDSGGGTGAIHDVDVDDIDPGDPLYTFPVLANWQFTCTDGADFQQLMLQLDVGMLDTVRLPPAGRVGRKPAPPRTRPLPEVTETGHISLSHVNRAGEADSVWYRGPLVPHPGGRQEPLFGVLPLLHSSDQARRIGPDGRENLSFAAAFEIGRLLALGEPSVVAAFLNWRKEGFEQARRTALVGTDGQLSLEEVRDIMSGFAARITSRILFELGRDGGIRFGDIRPPVDGGCPIDGLDNVDPVELIAIGFGLPIDTVRELIAPGVDRPGLGETPATRGPSDLVNLAGRTDVEFGHLRNTALDTVTTLATNALGGSAVPGGAPDALDELLSEGHR